MDFFHREDRVNTLHVALATIRESRVDDIHRAKLYL